MQSLRICTSRFGPLGLSAGLSYDDLNGAIGRNVIVATLVNEPGSTVNSAAALDNATTDVSSAAGLRMDERRSRNELKARAGPPLTAGIVQREDNEHKVPAAVEILRGSALES